ncbi:cytochrome c3 family protein [Prosthecobacter sp.]|uniref:cytochrome c3 family protein n=1 Tax=Prosthecobacter sp. TaxID=1965333 RepID=UPI003783227F
MNQLFPRSANTIARVALVGAVLGLAGLVWALSAVNGSSHMTRVGTALEQPVPFSHQHHAGELGIDCRYCHSTVAVSAEAGLPATETCMTCHSQVWKDAPMLQPVRESLRTGRPLQWTRVSTIPDFVYFNHSVHVKAGAACMECHGRVDRMPLTARQEPFEMRWCLDCHRHPAQRLSAPGTQFQMPDTKPADATVAARWMRQRHVETDTLTNCTACHR